MSPTSMLMRSSVVLPGDPSTLTRVTFNVKTLSRVLPNASSLAAGTPDKSTIVGVAQTLADIKVAKTSPISYLSIPEYAGVDYVGYIVEKERFDVKTLTWVRIDEYKIIGSSAMNFKDSRVAYGCQYRYRIKSIVKVTLPIINESLMNFELQADLQKLQTNDIKQRLEEIKGTLSQIETITNTGLTSKLSSGSPVTSFDIISGLRIQADATQMRPVSVAVDSQSGIANSLRIMKNLNVQDFDLTTGDITKVNLQRTINDSLSRLKEQAVEYRSYYYESEPSKNWIYTHVVENEPPPPPSSIMIVPSTPKKQVLITWLKPANSQRDIKYVRLYKKNAISDSWRVLAQTREVDVDENGNADPVAAEDSFMPVDVNLFVDTNIIVGQTYIYALTCVDAHGLESVLSTQIQAELNKDYDVEKEEKKLKWISGSGALPKETNIVYKKFFDQEMPIIATKSISIAPAHEFKETEKNLIIRVTSLDTHEVKEFKVVLQNRHLSDTQTEENIFVV